MTIKFGKQQKCDYSKLRMAKSRINGIQVLNYNTNKNAVGHNLKKMSYNSLNNHTNIKSHVTNASNM